MVEENDTPEKMIETRSSGEHARGDRSTLKDEAPENSFTYRRQCGAGWAWSWGLTYFFRGRESRPQSGEPCVPSRCFPLSRWWRRSDESLKWAWPIRHYEPQLYWPTRCAGRPALAWSTPAFSKMPLRQVESYRRIRIGCSIQMQGDESRVTVRLLSVPGGSQLWAQ